MEYDGLLRRLMAQMANGAGRAGRDRIMMMPDDPRRRRRDQQNGQEQSEDDAPCCDASKNAHGIQSTGLDALIVGQTCGENNWLHSGRFLQLTVGSAKLSRFALCALRFAVFALCAWVCATSVRNCDAGAYEITVLTRGHI